MPGLPWSGSLLHRGDGMSVVFSQTTLPASSSRGDSTVREMWINGAMQASASGQTIPVQDPATEEVIDSVPAGNAEDVHAAVDAAYVAFCEWRRVSAGERAELLHEVAAKLTAKTEAL